MTSRRKIFQVSSAPKRNSSAAFIWNIYTVIVGFFW